MNIAVIGSGNVGGALAKSLNRAGHSITLGTRNPESEKVKSLVQEVPGLQVTSPTEAGLAAEIIIFATPPVSVIELAKSLGNLVDKVIIDATNSVFSKPEPYPNASEALRDLTSCPHVVKCFNTTGFENMVKPVYGNTAADMFMAGNSAEGKKIARRLALDIGFSECYDFGGDDKIPLLEQLAMAWINLAIMQKMGRHIAFKILKK